jgi:flagellar operon protein
VDIKKVTGTENLGSVTPSSTQVKGPQSGPSFRDTLSQLQNEFASAKPQAALQQGALKFSNHAVERMQSRGVRFTPETMQKLTSAVEKAAAKGSKDTLLLTDDAALIVSVKNRTVVTVMDKDALKENVFTNIDSTVVV